MDVDSTDNRLEELSGFLKEEGSSFTAESDLSFVTNKDLSDPGQHSDLRYNDLSGSPSKIFQSDLQTGFHHDLLLNGARVAINHHAKEETEEEFVVDLLKSSDHVESENFHHVMGSEVGANLTNQEEKLEDRPIPLSHEKIGDGNLLEKSQFSYEEQEQEIYDLQSERLQGDNEGKREHNLEQNPLESTSPRTERKMTVSPLTSPSNKEIFASQEKCSNGKEVLLEDQKLGGDRQNAASPRESPRGSHRMNGGSPRNHGSREKHRRQYSSASRSPIRHRDSSSRHKRDHHHHRSRSRSPYRKDYYRRSPRRRYSPRHRSPPSSYHAYRRSPKRRHWSPPHNRSTGLGKPGRNLFVAGFSFLTTERDLERKFSRFGRVQDVRIVRDKRSGDSRGFGFLSLETDEEADAAIRALDKTEWHGRIVLVEKSKSH